MLLFLLWPQLPFLQLLHLLVNFMLAVLSTLIVDAATALISVMIPKLLLWALAATSAPTAAAFVMSVRVAPIALDGLLLLR